MLGVVEEEGDIWGGGGHNGPLCTLASLSLLDSGLPLSSQNPPTGMDKCQDVQKMHSAVCFWPPLLLPRLQWTTMVW